MRKMIRRAQALTVTAAAAAAPVIAALARNPVVRQEMRWVSRFARPLRRSVDLPPVPPYLPPGRVVNLPGRGEVFVRDSGGAPADPAVLLLHGWTASADLNFFPVYAHLAGSYRVIALDLRGHGRGMRSTEPFSLEDCADDAAALLGELGAGHVIVVGYSMGGPVGLLLARRHPGQVAALVMQATALEWRRAPHERMVWRLLSCSSWACGSVPGPALSNGSCARPSRRRPNSTSCGRGWPRSSAAGWRASLPTRAAR